VVGDWFGPGRYSQMIRCSDACRPLPADDMASLLQLHGARMMAINSARFPVSASDYLSRFDVVAQAHDGLLLQLRLPNQLATR
jgi:hypothetical protein